MPSTSEPVRIVVAPAMRGAVVPAIREIPGVEVVAPDRDGVAAALRDAPVLVSVSWRDEYLVSSLRWVQSISAGVEQFPAEALAEAGVVLTSASGVHAPQVAEHAFALLLAMTRGIAEGVRHREAREWRRSELHELRGRTIAVLGLGAIGEQIARIAAAFGMRVVGTKRQPEGYRGAAERVFPPDDTVAACRMADVVVIALPGGEATAGLVDREALAALGDGWLVNVGRGSVVDEEALVEALTAGRLRGAGLDVFAVEPLPEESPLWDLPGVVMSPHCAGTSPRYGERLAGIVDANLRALRGEGQWVNRIV